MQAIRVKQLHQSELTDFVNALVTTSSLTDVVNAVTAQVVATMGVPDLVSGLIASGAISGISGAYPPFSRVHYGNMPITVTSDVFNQIRLNFGTGYGYYFGDNNYTLTTQTIPSGETDYAQVSSMIVMEDLNLKTSGSFGLNVYCNRGGSGIPVSFDMMVTMFGTGWTGLTNDLSGIW